MLQNVLLFIGALLFVPLISAMFMYAILKQSDIDHNKCVMWQKQGYPITSCGDR